MFVNDADAQAALAIGCFASGLLLGEGKPQTLGGPVGLFLVDREENVDLQTACGCLSLITLEDRIPGDLMLVEHFLDGVILADIAEPAVELCEDDEIHQVCLDVTHQSHELRALLGGLPAGDTGINVRADDLIPMCGCPFSQDLLLVSERQTVPGLLLRGDSDI